MKYWKLTKIGSGSYADPFRPEGVDGLSWGSWQQSDGSFMVWTSAANTPNSATKAPLGTSLAEAQQNLTASTTVDSTGTAIK